MKELVLLEVLYGYEFMPKDNGNLAYHHEGEQPTEFERVKIAKLLDVVKERKGEAIQFLKTRRSIDDVIPFLFEAAGDCEKAARNAEIRGDLEEARRLWKRYAQIWAFIEPNPIIPWIEFIEN